MTFSTPISCRRPTVRTTRDGKSTIAKAKERTTKDKTRTPGTRHLAGSSSTAEELDQEDQGTEEDGEDG